MPGKIYQHHLLSALRYWNRLPVGSENGWKGTGHHLFELLFFPFLTALRGLWPSGSICQSTQIHHSTRALEKQKKGQSQSVVILGADDICGEVLAFIWKRATARDTLDQTVTNALSYSACLQGPFLVHLIIRLNVSLHTHTHTHGPPVSPVHFGHVHPGLRCSPLHLRVRCDWGRLFFGHIGKQLLYSKNITGQNTTEVCPERDSCMNRALGLDLLATVESAALIRSRNCRPKIYVGWHSSRLLRKECLRFQQPWSDAAACWFGLLSRQIGRQSVTRFIKSCCVLSGIWKRYKNP